MVRGSNKAYDDNDQLKGEYSISLFGMKYPLVTEKDVSHLKPVRKEKKKKHRMHLVRVE